MQIRACERCRKLFQYTSGSPMCPNCVREIDTLFSEVKNFLYDFPGSSMEEVCEATKADRALIIRWLREGRLVTDERSAALLTCVTCGKPIRIGQYCEDCKGNLQRTLNDTTRSMQKPDDKPRRTTEESAKKSKMHLRQGGKPGS